MNAVSLLCEIIAQTGKVSARSYGEDHRYVTLLDAGLLRPDGVVQSVACDNCDAPHDAEIVFEGEAYGHYCPELGFVPSARADLAAIRPNLPALVELLRTTLGCAPGSASQLGSQTWRIGLVETPGGRAVVYFHARLHDEHDLASLENALRGQVRRDFALVVTADKHLPYRDAAVYSLAQMVQMDLGTARLQATVSVAEAVGAPRERPSGRPSVYRERFDAILAERAGKGVVEQGRNAEANAALLVYGAKHPDDPAPKLSTAKAYVSEFRGG